VYDDDGSRCEFTGGKRTTSDAQPAEWPASAHCVFSWLGGGEIRKERWSRDGCRPPPHSDGWPPKRSKINAMGQRKKIPRTRR
jgi:hypothetical protein